MQLWPRGRHQIVAEVFRPSLVIVVDHVVHVNFTSISEKETPADYVSPLTLLREYHCITYGRPLYGGLLGRDELFDTL